MPPAAGSRARRRGGKRRVRRTRPQGTSHDHSFWGWPVPHLFFCSLPLALVAKALQEFDLALRGKKKRKKFMTESQKKAQMTVSSCLRDTPP